jgi:hypothetical protein
VDGLVAVGAGASADDSAVALVDGLGFAPGRAGRVRVCASDTVAATKMATSAAFAKSALAAMVRW